MRCRYSGQKAFSLAENAVCCISTQVVAQSTHAGDAIAKLGIQKCKEIVIEVTKNI